MRAAKKGGAAVEDDRGGAASFAQAVSDGVGELDGPAAEEVVRNPTFG